jgi:hypothetical protein
VGLPGRLPIPDRRDEVSCGHVGQRRCRARSAALGSYARRAALHLPRLELSEDGKAMKYFELVPFEALVTAETVVRALAEDDGKDALQMEESDQ